MQEGAELTYLLRHDPEFRSVRRSDLIEVGRRIRLKRNIALLADFLKAGIDGIGFDFYVVSAAPEDVVHSALAGIVPPITSSAPTSDSTPSRVRWNRLSRCRPATAKWRQSITSASDSAFPTDRVVYVGDGSSDIHVMLHVNRGDGLTIAASEARHISQIAQRTVMSEDAMSVLIPILEEICGYDRGQIRLVFEEQGLLIQEWDRVRPTGLTIRLTMAAVEPGPGNSNH